MIANVTMAFQTGRYYGKGITQFLPGRGMSRFA